MFGVGLLAIGGLVAATVMLSAEKPDPHYVEARRMVTDYEQGKPVERRNYSNQLYQTALDELAQVGPESISAEPAKSLSDEIRNGIRDFEGRQQNAQTQRGMNLDKHRQAQQKIQANNARERANPQTDYPECDDGEGEAGGPSGS